MDKIQKSYLGPRLFVIAALAVAAWALVYKTGVANSDEAGIVLHLPEQVGDWRGVDLFFCPSRECGGQYAAGQIEDPTSCPKCGARLGNMNWAERSILPADTGLVRKYYARAGNQARDRYAKAVQTDQNRHHDDDCSASILEKA